MKPFCPNCGIKDTKQEFEKKRLQVMGKLCGVIFFVCDSCGFMIDIVIQEEPKKTEEEVEAAFQQIELTDYQKTGRANTGKWARKKKSIIPNVSSHEE